MIIGIDYLFKPNLRMLEIVLHACVIWVKCQGDLGKIKSVAK